MNSGARVLIVDDSTENRLLLKVFLKKHPVEVDEATDGAEAVERVVGDHYALVLMDVHMPVMDGLDATRTIRQREHADGLARTPILALTADDTPADHKRSLEAGCDDHLVKPITRERLAHIMQHWLQQGPTAR